MYMIIIKNVVGEEKIIWSEFFFTIIILIDTKQLCDKKVSNSNHRALGAPKIDLLAKKC